MYCHLSRQLCNRRVPLSNPLGQRLKKQYQAQRWAHLRDVLLPAEELAPLDARRGKLVGEPPALKMAACRQQLGVAPGIGLYYTENLDGESASGRGLV